MKARAEQKTKRLLTTAYDLSLRASPLRARHHTPPVWHCNGPLVIDRHAPLHRHASDGSSFLANPSIA
ncbi:MAG: hypothetical protein PVG42_05280, partial [Lysobacterales bacterium]